MVEDPAANIELASFKPLIGESFTLELEDQNWSAELREAEEIPNHRPDASRQPFSLSFKAGSPDLPQASYQVSHPSLPSLHIFLVPVGGDQSSTTLQAIFN